MRSIRVKITVITIAAILTSVVSVLAASFFTVRAENDRSSAEKLNLLSQAAEKTLDEYFSGIEQSVEMAANIAADSLDGIVLAEGGVTGAPEDLERRSPEQIRLVDEHLKAHCQRIQQAFSSVANRTHGVITYYYCIRTEVSEQEHGFFYAKAGKTGFARREDLDARTLDPSDDAHTAWYFLPIQRGRPSWVGPYQAHFLNEMWMISYVVPIYKTGNLIGVLGMDIPLETLLEQIRPIRVYDTGFACLLDEEGRVIYHPQIERGSLPDISNSALYDTMLQQDQSGEELLRYSLDGEERQLSFATLSTGMKLVVTVPVREINAAWTRLTTIILFATAAIIAFFGLVVLFAMDILTRPLQRLTAASRRLAAGDYDMDLTYKGRDEVGTLTQAFDQMRVHLKGYIDDLNRRIDTDDLTGLPSMSRFFTLAEERRDELLYHGGKPCMLYFNLVGMKYYNRQYGFAQGDRLLREAARILEREFGHQNCCRIGQDHFAAVCDEAQLEEQLKTVFRAFSQANNGRSLPVRVGIYPSRLGTVDVNVACDRAKFAYDQDRNSYLSNFYYFDEAMLRRVEHYRYIINNLDRALEERWVKVYFQPIVRAANGRVCDEEALSRWIDPVKGFLSPGDYIPILESSRLIYKLDLYVLDQILLKMRHQHEMGLYVVPQSLNLSRVDFDVCDIIEEVRRRVDEAGIAREKLTIEVTESAVGGDFERMKEQILRFQKLGFQVWMDDFGSGYSSLDVLQDIRFDLIKFDMRFMHRFEEGDESKIILTELIQMALALGVETVAEGVETEQQVEFLREVGCTKLQGYYYCKAIPMEEIVERNRKGIQIGFENPEETGYYTAIGRINLYDVAALSNDSTDRLSGFFDTMPMAVLESDAEKFQLTRCNRAYREFLDRLRKVLTTEYVDQAVSIQGIETGPTAPFLNALDKSCKSCEVQFVDEVLPNGATIRSMIRHIAVNPVTGISASAVVILNITDPPGGWGED